jgi:hypothetical protein
MASVPISMNQLESITESVARDLLEQWAIEDRFTEDQIGKAQQDAIDDTAFVINAFMTLLNETMMTSAEQSKLI